MAKQAKPWDKANPRKKVGKPSKKLSPKKKASAKASAKRAGRKYPSLVDNMNAAKSSKKSSTKKSSAKKPATKKRVTKKKTSKKRTTKKASKKRKTVTARSTSGARTKDPKGGLTSAGRAAFKKSQGANLKPGVRTHGAKMTPQDMKRKGSWAVRFYGRDPLPPLVGKNGEPTRLALSAHAWGEPVPKTEAAARRIAAKGRKLLEKYEKSKTSASKR